jgi:DNA-directed RNA polymerase subunit RPC12/RpoP
MVGKIGDVTPSGSPDPAKVRCPNCQSRLDVLETPSGGRIVSVAYLGASVEMNAHALERFVPPDGGREVQCPACSKYFDPSGPRLIPRLRRI